MDDNSAKSPTDGDVDVPWFVMPRSPQGWGGAAALWVTAAGWAGASRRRFGVESPIVTPAGVLDEAACLDATSLGASSSSSGGGRASWIPTDARQVVKDVRVALTQQRYRRSVVREVHPPGRPLFVWQHHELFHRAGEALARREGVPLVEYVHAPIVWEARRWGVHRRLTGRPLQRFGESPSLRRADVAACVSHEVAEELRRWGIGDDRLVVAPMAVDPERFSPSGVRAEREADAPLRVGWVGSFRRFHAIDLLLHAARRLRDDGAPIEVVLIGDGFERDRLRSVVDDLGIEDVVTFRGQIANTQLPAELDRLDVAVITAEAGQEFHYSPLKLREYMAMALPVVAPNIGDVGRIVDDGVTGLLYEPGDVDGLAGGLASLMGSIATRDRIGGAARHQILRTGTWDVVLGDVVGHLGSSSGS